MKFRDLREFLDTLEANGDLVRIKEEIDPNLEMTEIADRTLRGGGPALLFENPKGYSTPVLANLFGTEKRVALGMGADSTEALREIGELLVCGPSSASCYWNQRDKSLNTFQGEWTRSGDKYYLDEEGYYCYCGRTDDMLKVSGIWVSPFEVESALLGESRVLEAAVVGQEDDQGMVKPKAVIVLQEGVTASPNLVAELQAFVKDRLAPFKYPRWIEFVDELPKTATGKIQRFKLRAQNQKTN